MRDSGTGSLCFGNAQSPLWTIVFIPSGKTPFLTTVSTVINPMKGDNKGGIDHDKNTDCNAYRRRFRF
ncbi:hypothetical protein LCGC14_1529270 [marine sediment metagenome]|uniref:Uncharacterized protein n=1 Tax=marine sediment metagenome TaxID=412755 RepID=A0A0F9IWN0_9ZZZZ